MMVVMAGIRYEKCDDCGKWTDVEKMDAFYDVRVDVLRKSCPSCSEKRLKGEDIHP